MPWLRSSLSSFQMSKFTTLYSYHFVSLFPKFAYFVPLFWNTIPPSSFDFQETSAPGSLPPHPQLVARFLCYCFRIIVCYVKRCASVPGSPTKVEATWGLLPVTHVGMLCVWAQTASYICTGCALRHCRAADRRALRFLPPVHQGPDHHIEPRAGQRYCALQLRTVVTASV